MPLPIPTSVKAHPVYRLLYLQLYQPLRFRWIRLRKRGVQSVVFDGLQARFCFRTPIELERIRELVMPNANETQFLRAFLNSCTRATVVYDIGSNIGLFSVLAAIQGRERTVVHAFEPHANNCEAIRENVAVNQLSNVTVHQLALGEAPTIARLSSTDHSRGVGTHRVSDSGPSDGHVVNVESIDSLVARGLPPPDVLKIDVEGYELHVLKGMRRVAESKDFLVFLEFHETLLGPDARGQLDATLRDLGLRIDRTFLEPSLRSETHYLIASVRTPARQFAT